MIDQINSYVRQHTSRGECQCGRCVDKMPDRDAPPHSVNVHFFWVSSINDPDKYFLRTLLSEHYPDRERLRKGPGYIELGGVLGDQSIALRLIGLGGILGLWEVVTPASLGITGDAAKDLAGKGFVYCSGLKENKAEVDNPRSPQVP